MFLPSVTHKKGAQCQYTQNVKRKHLTGTDLIALSTYGFSVALLMRLKFQQKRNNLMFYQKRATTVDDNFQCF